MFTLESAVESSGAGLAQPEQLGTHAQIRATSCGIFVETPGEIDIFEILAAYLPVADRGTLERMYWDCSHAFQDADVQARATC